MYSRHWLAWLFIRKATDADLVEQRSSVEILHTYRDGYWLYLDLASSHLSITHENLVSPLWERA